VACDRGSRNRRRAGTLGGLALVTALVLAGCNGTHRSTTVTLPTHGMESRIVLSTTHVMAGHPMAATLVVDNPGSAVNLTRITHCRPPFAIYLSNSRLDNQPVIPLDCSSRPFVIAHGTTRLRTTIPTTYSSCVQGPDGDAATPTCLPGAGSPPLPRGTYQAKETFLPLPDPAPVAVTLTG
jgi:hypothetical protein